MDQANLWDAQELFDLYLLDYMRKRNMYVTAALFSAEANVPQVDVAFNESPEGFLYEWWTIMYETLASRYQMRNTREVQPPPISNEEIRQLLTGVPTMMAQPSPPRLATSQRRPTMTYPNLAMVSARNFHQEQLNNFMPPVGHIHSPLPKMMNISGIVLPPTFASSSSANVSYLLQQPVHSHQIQYPLMINNGPGITIGGNSGSMIECSTYAAQLANHRGIIPPDAGRSIQSKPMLQLERLPINPLLMEAQNNQPSFSPEMEQVQQNPTGQGDENLQELQDSGNSQLETFDDQELEEFVNSYVDGHNIDEDFALIDSGLQDMANSKGGAGP